jgi:putative ATPase
VLEEFLPDSISNTRIYEPGESSREEQFRQKLKKTWGDKYGY